MKLKRSILALAIVLASGSVFYLAAAPKAPRNIAASENSGCFEADCLVDGWSPHWSATFSTSKEAEEAAAEHRRQFGDRHQVVVGACY